MNVADALYEITKKLDGRFAEQVFVAKEYSIADLRRDLLRVAIASSERGTVK